ncbi:MAG: protein-disulfide reductase DsbD domain-containing protein [Pseudomonadota bacterium]
MSRISPFVPALLVGLGTVAVPWQAATQAIVSTGQSYVSARLLLGSVDEDGDRLTGLELRLKPEWKTYWRAPGEAGVPPHMDWSASENVAEVEIIWPRPYLFESFGLMTIGYADHVVLPIRVTPADPAQPAALIGDLTLGVCREICVFEQTEVSLHMAPDSAAQDGGQIARYLKEVPPAAADAGLQALSCQVVGTGEDRSFSAQIAFDRTIEDPMVVLEGPEDAWFHQTKYASRAGEIAVQSTLTVFDQSAWVDRSDIRMTVLAKNFSADIQGCGPLPG